MPKYTLPKKWVDYLMNQPETGMGYQMLNIHFPDKTLEYVVTTNRGTFECEYKGLNIKDIVEIEVLRKEDLSKPWRDK